MDKDNAIRKMNYYGKNKIPFLFVVDFEMAKPILMLLSDVKSKYILYNVNGVKNYKDAKKINRKIVFRKYPISFQRYKRAFSKVQKHFFQGHSYLLNLTFPTRIEANFTLKEIFLNSQTKYKLFFNDEFIVFSPETFIKIKNQKIYSYPMKGTIDASIQNASQKIISDKKEFAEHLTIVDLIRNDISIVSKNVRVNRFRYVEKIITHDKELLQVSSEIIGELENNYNEKIGDIIFSLLPAGSISGAPKKKTVEIIKEVENYKRGYYTGIFGIFDGQNLDSAVMIRYIEKHSDETIFKSGGGITTYSDLKSEYQELIDKVYVPVIGNN